MENAKMKKLVAFLFLFLLLGCGVDKVNIKEQQNDNPKMEERLSPADSGVFFDLAIKETVQHGKVWIILSKLPENVRSTWYIGLTDNGGHEFILGQPNQSDEPIVFDLPEGVSSGEGKVWLSSGNSETASGTLYVPLTIQKAYDTFESNSLGVRFKVPRGWRIYEGSDSILLQRDWQRPAQPLEDILIQRSNAKEMFGIEKKEKETKIAVAGQIVTQTWLMVQTVNKTASWREIHTVINGFDVVLQYRLWKASPELDKAYEQILKSFEIIRKT